MFAGLSVAKLALILFIGLVIFGPKHLPEIGKAMGKSIHEFKKEAEAKEELPQAEGKSGNAA